MHLVLAFGAKSIFFCTWMNDLGFVLCGRDHECSSICMFAPGVWLNDISRPSLQLGMAV